jgi:serine/threonine protein kinase/tetratricopeptide (TPR) repeat protein
MDLPGLTDSLANVVREVAKCNRCDGVSRLANGLCLGCLMQAGLDDQDEEHAESLQSILTKIDIRDSDWRIGHYQILEEIGRGGMGVIYRARQQHSGRIVAVKRVLSFHSDSPETLARFRREAEAASLLDHPNILPIYEVGESEDGLPFFAMKFAPGGSLKEVGPALNHAPDRIVPLMVSVARAVQSAHAQGLLHRDLKPGNILLDGRGEPLVSDFGLAKWLDASNDLTRTMTIFGTPGYIAPEQVRGPTVRSGPASDIYSLGAILFDLLAGRPPFLGEHALAVVSQAVEKAAPPLRSLVPSIDRDLETICARCLDRDPAARYSSADALADDLERWTQGESIWARPISPLARIWRWSRRNRVLASALCGCLVLGGIGITRHLRSQQLQAALNREQLAAHSIAILPLLNLDDGGPDLQVTHAVANILQQQMSSVGVSAVHAAERPLRWTGAGTQEEVDETAKKTGNRAVLTGTLHKVPSGTRYSLHLINPASHELLGTWIFEGSNDLSALLHLHKVGASAYELLDKHFSRASVDPAMENDEARPFMIAGCDLLVRRNIADMDRAIACFEGAVRAEPRSINARSFLAMAYMGRDILSSDAKISARALQSARDAIQLSPENPTAHRAYGTICMTNGRYLEGKEHSFQALEYGDQSERTFGLIGYSLRMSGHADRAIDWYLKAKVSQRQPADYDALLGDCYVDLGLEELARREFESAAIHQPDQPEGWIGLCQLKLFSGDIEAARAIYRAELPKYSASPAASQMAALVEFFARNYKQAEQLYSHLAVVDPAGGGRGGFSGAVDYSSALARLSKERGDRNRAITLAKARINSEKTHLATTPDDAESLYRLAAAEAVVGSTEEALCNLRLAAEAGWLDYRSPQFDPRFDNVSETPSFREILSRIIARQAHLREEHTSIQSAEANQRSKPHG